MTVSSETEPSLEALRCRPEEVVERFTDPLGGLALIETGVDVHELLSFIDRSADAVIGPSTSEASHYWMHYENDDGSRRVNLSVLESYFSEQRDSIRNIYAVCSELMRPLHTQFSHPTIEKGDSLTVAAIRRQVLRPTHVDFSVATLWLGATKPGLRVQHNNEWITVDTVPPGHALLWRGILAHMDGIPLPPTPHYSSYRSMARRIVMISSY